MAAEQGNMVAKMIVQKESVKPQMFAILTWEQKAKAEEMRTNFEVRIKDHEGFGDRPTGSKF